MAVFTMIGNMVSVIADNFVLLAGPNDPDYERLVKNANPDSDVAVCPGCGIVFTITGDPHMDHIGQVFHNNVCLEKHGTFVREDGTEY